MNEMLHWSPVQKFHFHPGADNQLDAFLGAARQEAPEGAAWIPAAEGRVEDASYIIRLALPGVDPKDVTVSLMDDVLTVKGERKADHDTTGKEYFVREVAYGTFRRDFTLPENVDASKVEAKHAQGMLEVRVPKPIAATARTIEIKAA